MRHAAVRRLVRQLAAFGRETIGRLKHETDCERGGGCRTRFAAAADCNVCSLVVYF